MAEFPSVQYFLGANAPGGFYSLYDQLLPRGEARAVYILKGGPGCGKSTLMRWVGQTMAEEGLPTETILCSGDPDSVDGVYVPAWQVAYVDGTAPHVREVPFPAASGAYLDLGQFYRCEELVPKLPELMRLTERYRAHYARAYDELRQAKALHDELESVYNPHVDFARVYALANSHVLRLLREN